MSSSRMILRIVGVCLAVTVLAAGAARADVTDVRINEVYASHTGVDTVEFFELYGPTDTNLSGLTILVVDGDGNSKGRITHAIAVSGTLPADGLWVIGTPGCPNPGAGNPPDQLLDDVQVTEILPNGTQTYLLVTDFTGAVNDDLDANNDSQLDPSYLATLGTIIDSVAVHDGGLSDATYAGAPVIGPAACGASFCEPAGAARKTDGQDTDTDSDWCITSFDVVPPNTGVGADGYEAAAPGVANNYTCNSAPIAESQSVPVVKDASPGVIITLVAIDDGLPDGTLEYTIATLPASGTLTDPDDGDAAVSMGTLLTADHVRYTPAAGVTGGFSFTFTADDGDMESDPATVTLTVYENMAPAAEDDEVAVEQDASPGLIIDLVATDDDFPPGRVLVYTIASLPTLGTLTDPDDGDAPVGLNDDLTANRVRYTPDPGEAGSDAFTFTVNDGELISNTATVSVEVMQNIAPVAEDDAVAVLPDASPGLIIDLVATDDGLPGGPLVYTIVSLPTRGTLTDPDDGDSAVGADEDLTADRVRYTPDPGETGNDAFTFKANDGALDSNVATISVSIHVPAEPVVLAKWTFEVSVPTTAGPHAAEEGIYGGDASGWHADQAVVYSNPVGNGSTESFSSTRWSAGDYYQFESSSLGHTDVEISFDQTRSSTGPGLFDILISTNGSDWTTLVEDYGVNVASWTTGSHDPSSVLGPFPVPALDNQATIYVRLVSQVTVATTGTNRVDNVIIEGTPDEETGVPPVLTGAVSARMHGLLGPFSVNVGGGAVEGRTGGPTSLVATFDIPVQRVGEANDVTLSSGTVSDVTVDGSTVTVTMAGAANAQPLTVGFPGVADANDVTAVSESMLCFRVLAGDVSGDGSVNVLDLVQVRNALNQAATGANFRADINADGTANVLDLVAARNNLNTSVAACP